MNGKEKSARLAPMVSVPGPATIRFSLAVLVLANLLPLGGVLFFGWSVFQVMALFWLENVIVGAYNLLRMATQILKGQFAIIVLMAFFTVHYGMFCAVHGLFVMGIFGHDQPIPGGKIQASPLAAFALMEQMIEADATYWWATIGLVASHGVSFLVNFLGSGEWKRVDASTLMFAPYKRVVILHLTILAARARSRCSVRRSGASSCWLSSRPWSMHGRISPSAGASPGAMRRRAPLHHDARYLISSRHELGFQRSFPEARLSPRQSARGADRGRPAPDRREGPGRLHRGRGRARGGRFSGGALPAFPRPRRDDGGYRQARLREFQRKAAGRVGWRQAEPGRGLPARGPRLSRLRAGGTRDLFRDVRKRPLLREPPRAARGFRAGLHRPARGLRGGDRRHARPEKNRRP